MYSIYLILLLTISLTRFDSIKLCNQDYKIEIEREFLKDDKLWAKVAYVTNSKDKKRHFGYIIEGKRNDTIFMYSNIFLAGDTVIRTNHYLHNISSIDSMKTRWLCFNYGFKLISSTSYKSGKITREERF